MRRRTDDALWVRFDDSTITTIIKLDAFADDYEFVEQPRTPLFD